MRAWMRGWGHGYSPGSVDEKINEKSIPLALGICIHWKRAEVTLLEPTSGGPKIVFLSGEKCLKKSLGRAGQNMSYSMSHRLWFKS